MWTFEFKARARRARGRGSTTRAIRLRSAARALSKQIARVLTSHCCNYYAVTMASSKNRMTTAIRFPEAMHEQLKEAADERDLSINFLVVKAVEEFLERLVPADEFRLTRV
jgi:hypothetical protein